MNLNTLNEFRHAVYPCFTQAQDALFNVGDALLTETTAHAFAELSFSPYFERRWPSLYAAFKDGRIERGALRQVLARYVKQPTSGRRVVVGVDATNIARPESPTAGDRTYLYVHNLPECSAPVTSGWSFSTVVVLPETPSSWTYILDNLRIPSAETAGNVAAAQLAALVPLVNWRVLVTADRYYGSAAFVQATVQVDCDKLLRIPSNRVLYAAAPARTGRRGAPKKDGARFKCNDPRTHSVPTETWSGQDDHGQRIRVTAWADVHFKRCRSVSLTLIRVERESASGKKRDPFVSWFIWIGKDRLPLSQVWPTYRLRYSEEHGYRFDKQDLLWLDPHFRTPDQFQRWTDVLSVVHDELALAHTLVEVQRRPWESSQRPTTPRQVRRAMGAILAQLGTPAASPQPRGKSTGRAKGTHVKPAPRYSVVRKAKKTARKRGKR
jgi:hypothetical protein